MSIKKRDAVRESGLNQESKTAIETHTTLNNMGLASLTQFNNK